MLTSTGLPRWAAATAVYLDRERPDALLAMLTPSVVAATMAVRMARHRVKVVGTFHGGREPSRRWHTRARRSYPRCDATVGVSHGVATVLTNVYGVPAYRVHTIHDPLVSASLVCDMERPSGHPWLDGPGSQVILAAGRLVEVKDFSSLLAAFALLVACRPARLIVLGQGRLRARLTSEAEALGVADLVDFPGSCGTLMPSWRRRACSSSHRGAKDYRTFWSKPWPAAVRSSAPTVRSGRARSWKMDGGVTSCRSGT